MFVTAKPIANVMEKGVPAQPASVTNKLLIALGGSSDLG
jgi:hypothetical protein|tara:strand:- start:2586 stop:2702 length:117 start_codon:yes stop_codon:yes gene_type:complete